jgi:hypothetical protein
MTESPIGFIFNDFGSRRLGGAPNFPPNYLMPFGVKSSKIEIRKKQF